MAAGRRSPAVSSGIPGEYGLARVHRLHGTCGARENSYALSCRLTLGGERVLSIGLGTALDRYL